MIFVITVNINFILSPVYSQQLFMKKPAYIVKSYNQLAENPDCLSFPVLLKSTLLQAKAQALHTRANFGGTSRE
jgi:hypothetical protein